MYQFIKYSSNTNHASSPHIEVRIRTLVNTAQQFMKKQIRNKNEGKLGANSNIEWTKQLIKNIKIFFQNKTMRNG